VATASQFSAETVVPAVVGLLVLGDRARNGLGAVAALGFVLTVGAAVALTVVSPPEQTPPRGPVAAPRPATDTAGTA
jgi:hypothetical protein